MNKNIFYSILDSSCGDMNWMPRFLENRTDIDFTGYDITLSNIEAHQLNFANKSWTFKVKSSEQKYFHKSF